MEWPRCVETKVILGQRNVSSISKKSFQHLFIPDGININSASVLVLGKKGPMMWYCEMVHNTVSHSKYRDFVICQFGLSAKQ